MFKNIINFLFFLLGRINFYFKKLIKAFNALKRQTKIEIFVCLVSFILLLFLSPILSIYWLVLPTIFFICSKKYKSIFIVWGIFFLSWYLLFVGCLYGFDGPIVIGRENTLVLVHYLSIKYPGNYSSFFSFNFFFESLCFQTIIFLDILSEKIDCFIYIPSLFKGLFFLFKFFFGGKGPAECCPKNKPEKSSFYHNWQNGKLSLTSAPLSPKSPKLKMSTFKEDSDYSTCAELEKTFNSRYSIFSYKSKVVKGRCITTRQAFIPFWDTFKMCTSRAATPEEIKNSKK